MSGYPIQIGKVQRPPLRDETLARHRLLDWLDVKIHNRIVFVTAEAGYGKTTLLADFSRRTRLRTLWYRMDEEDRNWVSFLSYLVAAGRVHDPEFGALTSSMLEDTGPGGASRDDVLDAFIRELPSIATDGAAIVLDDFHVADDVPDIRHIAKQLIERAPERLTLVFASRRTPPVPVARLRALGELAELVTTDLRFSDSETAALFSETYGRPLEPDVLADLTRRTEGWAASLYLVQAALRDRTGPETRAFIRRLTGAHSEIYDYLAEEVVGDLPEEHQQFLMRTSILQVVQSPMTEAATDVSAEVATSLIAASEHLGLLSRRQGLSIGHSFHPLVREFLEVRLRREWGEAAVADLHRRIADAVEGSEWAAACYHYAAAGDATELLRVLEASVETVIGTGQVGIAAEYLADFAPAVDSAPFEVIRSRHAGMHMDLDAALTHARRAVELDDSSDSTLGNLLATYFLTGDQASAYTLAERLARSAASSAVQRVGTASLLVMAASMDGSTAEAMKALQLVRDESRRLRLPHYEGVSLLNMALLSRAQGAAEATQATATEAVEILGRGAAGSEVVAAELAIGWAQAHGGQIDQARTTLARAAERCSSVMRLEWLTEAAEIETWYGDALVAETYLDEARSMTWNASFASVNVVTRVELALRNGDVGLADESLHAATLAFPSLESAFMARCQAVTAHVAVRMLRPEAPILVRDALAFAQKQGSELWAGYSESLLAATQQRIDAELGRVLARGPVFLSMVAETWISQLNRLSSASMESILLEAASRPERWRTGLRRSAADIDNPSRIQAARLLDVVGERADIPLLRAVARSARLAPSDKMLGRGLARRLADPIDIEDQGRVEIRIGRERIPGTELRRKVLAMLCFLLSRPKYAATRDEVVDALWPDLAPEIALNSLNQTVYFLRRVFEPGYKDDHSAGYVNHDSDVLWLDDTLVTSRSRRCRALIDSLGAEPAPSEIELLSDLYCGRFALDFAYEEWAVPYRDALHVSYLHLMEAAVTRDMETGHYDRAIRLARRALDVDPDHESLELSLLRLYRVTGAHAAAAEQYAHYAAYLRDELGVDPPPLASL